MKPRTPRWGRLDVGLLEGEDGDEVAGRLALGAQGAEVGEGFVRIWFSTVEAAQARAAELQLERSVRVHPVEEEPWLERYVASLGPLPLGRRFVVLPHERAGPAGGRIALHIAPGRAFGTGEHPTTRLCAEALERFVPAAPLWLDLGTGTGILALVAACCGARSVLALDVDPEAVAVARANVARHGLSGTIRVAQGSLERTRPGRFDGIVANLSAPFFAQEAPALCARLRRGGRLVASGFPVEAREEVFGALRRAGLELEEQHELEGWVAAVFRRETP